MIKILDIVSMVLELVKNGNFMALIVLLLLIFYVFPLVVVGGLSWDNTNRLEKATREGTQQTITAIERLGNHLDIRTAKK